MNKDQIRAYVLADNKLALEAGWDREMLAIELQGLVDLNFEVELTAALRPPKSTSYSETQMRLPRAM